MLRITRSLVSRLWLHQPGFTRLFIALSISQITGWGTLYYGFSLFTDPVQHSTGWSYSFINLAITLSLIMWGLTAPFAGTLVGRYGGRGMMTTGSLVAGLSFSLWAFFPENREIFLAAWALAGIAMAMVLYEPACAVLTTEFKQGYRKAIALLTITGGLASTVFIPLIHFVMDWGGWQTTIWFLALLNLLICAPLHYLYLPDRGKIRESVFRPRSVIPDKALFSHPKFNGKIFTGLLIWFSTFGVATSALSFLLIPLLSSMEIGMNQIVLMMAIIGPMQIAGRLGLASRRSIPASDQLGGWIVATLSAALLILIFFHHIFLLLMMFGILYGLSKGVMTVVRKTAIADLMTTEIYAETNGWLAMGYKWFQAVTPMGLAWVWHSTGSAEWVLWLVFAASLSGLAGLYLLRSERNDKIDEYTVKKSCLKRHAATSAID